tara:strand:+ start:440 stop:655 length:216 start_codon:yes stop_codon:yes gene_type:complete
MAIMQKFVEQTDWLWYNAELTDEQTAEYKAYLDALETDEPIDEPEWLYELDYDLVRDKPGSDDTTFELIED